MYSNERKHVATGAVAIASTLAPARAFRLAGLTVHLSAAGGAGNLTITVDATAGSAYDLVVLTQDMTAVVDLTWQPTEPLFFEPGDEIDVAWANANSRTYGLALIWEAL